MVVELDAISGTELGDDRQNICLLLGREFVFAMIESVVWPVATTEVTPYTMACLSPLVVRHILIKLTESPRLFHQFLLTETTALAVLPGCGIYCLSDIAPLCRQQTGLIVHALVLQTACIVKNRA